MSHLLHIPDSLARTLDELFASSPLQPTERVAKVLNICGKTLRRAGGEGKIAYSLKGKAHRLHTREAVEAYYLARSLLHSSVPVHGQARDSIQGGGLAAV